LEIETLLILFYLKVYIARKDNSWFTIDCSRNNQIIARDEIAEKVWKAVSKILN
jgi:hypothetical protein